MAATEQDIVIVGGSYAGINAAHYILQFVVPALKTPHRVVLISPSKSIYHRVAGPRAVVAPDLYPADKLFYSIASAFANYTDSRFQHIQGTVTSVDPATHSLALSTADGPTSKSYRALVLATGARSHDPALSSQGGPDTDITDAQSGLHSRLKTAKTVIVGGGGPAGVEVASEIAEHMNGRPGWFGFGSAPPRKVDIQLITGADKLLPILRPALATEAERMLKGMGVQTTYKTRIAGAERLADGRTKVKLENGKTLEADVYIDATGTFPMTGYLPQSWVDEKKRVKVTAALRVVGQQMIYAVGDLHDHTRGGALEIYDSVPVLSTNLKADLLVADGEKRSHGDRVFVGKTDESQIVTIGQSRGVGAFGGIKMPSIMIWGLKGRDYMHGMTKDAMEGRKWKKEVGWKAAPLSTIT